MNSITADDVLAIALEYDGQVLQTIHRKKQFRLDAHDDEIIYTPLVRDRQRIHDRATLEKICREYNKTRSLRPTHYYHTGTWNASYTLTLINMLSKRRLTLA